MEGHRGRPPPLRLAEMVNHQGQVGGTASWRIFPPGSWFPATSSRSGAIIVPTDGRLLNAATLEVDESA